MNEACLILLQSAYLLRVSSYGNIVLDYRYNLLLYYTSSLIQIKIWIVIFSISFHWQIHGNLRMVTCFL